LGQAEVVQNTNTADLFQPTMNNTLAIVQHALVLLLTYGTGKEWSNQRRACLTFQFKHPETDVTQDNYIDTSGNSVLLVINTATKVKHTVTINVSKDCPVLAKLLKSITHPKKFTANSLLVGFPTYVLFQCSWRQRKHFGQKLSDPSTFNTVRPQSIVQSTTERQNLRNSQARPRNFSTSLATLRTCASVFA